LPKTQNIAVLSVNDGLVISPVGTIKVEYAGTTNTYVNWTDVDPPSCCADPERHKLNMLYRVKASISGTDGSKFKLTVPEEYQRAKLPIGDDALDIGYKSGDGLQDTTVEFICSYDVAQAILSPISVFCTVHEDAQAVMNLEIQDHYEDQDQNMQSITKTTSIILQSYLSAQNIQDQNKYASNVGHKSFFETLDWYMYPIYLIVAFLVLFQGYRIVKMIYRKCCGICLKSHLVKK
jgi:hypothetical protein